MKTSLLIILATTLLFFAGALVASVAYHKWVNKQRRLQQTSEIPDLFLPSALLSSDNDPAILFHKPHFKTILMDAGITAHYPF